MAIPENVFPAISAISAALIGGSISFISVVISKENKISDFRQEWIDSLRNDISEYSGITANLYLNSLAKISESPTAIEEYLAGRHDDFLKLNVTSTRILLRLNPREHTELIDMLGTNDALVSSRLKSGEWRTHLTHLTTISSEILRKEWKRVKRGEITYQLTKWVSLAGLLSAIIFSCLYYFNHISISFIP